MAFKLIKHRFSKSNETIVTGLDIGSSKVCCAIARIESSGDLTVLGYGYQGSKGLRGGMIIDMEALQDAVAHAVHGAEEMAGETIEEVYVSISPALCQSKSVRVDLSISAHPVDDDDIKKIIQQAKQINPEIIVIIDAAQAVPHIKVDVQDLNCDFLVFSSHKMLGPTGVGVLWGRKELLEHMNPFLYGGEMIETVSTKQTTYKTTPQKFEAGTPHIAGIIALREAIEYINAIGLKHIYLHEQTLVNYAIHFLEDSFKKKIQIFGPREMRSGIISFTLDKIHPHDIAQLLNDDHIAVRAGNHCAMPLHTRLHITASIRASFYLYNTTHDIDMLVKSLHKAIKIIG